MKRLILLLTITALAVSCQPEDPQPNPTPTPPPTSSNSILGIWKEIEYTYQYVENGPYSANGSGNTLLEFRSDNKIYIRGMGGMLYPAESPIIQTGTYTNSYAVFNGSSEKFTIVSVTATDLVLEKFYTAQTPVGIRRTFVRY